MLRNSRFGFFGTAMLRIALLCLTVFFVACGTIGSKFSNHAISSGSEFAASGFPNNQYDGSPEINRGDYLPAGGSMQVETHNVSQIEYNWVLDYRLRVSPFMYVGLTATPLTIYFANDPNLRGINEISDCGMFFCDVIRYATLHWWDEVVVDSYTAKYTPSIGWTMGLILAESEEESGKYQFFFEYAMSFRHYSFRHDIYAGKDCQGCINSSYVKESIDMGSGLAWRHAIKIGGGHCSGIFWIELAGLQVAAGIGLRLSGNLFSDYDPGAHR